MSDTIRIVCGTVIFWRRSRSPISTRPPINSRLQDDYSRGYVFCDLLLDPDARTTIRSLIAAMRTWRAIPKAVVFDNGSPFKGRLLSAFCDQLGVRLIHASVNHPQTNGKLERAFRDDMRDFYQHYDAWLLDRLRRDLPNYVHYRNYVRGHHALGGNPAISRLKEHTPNVTLLAVWSAWKVTPVTR
jgi:transposase InsO family protein